MLQIHKLIVDIAESIEKALIYFNDNRLDVIFYGSSHARHGWIRSSFGD
jgi:hypothetical protein